MKALVYLSSVALMLVCLLPFQASGQRFSLNHSMTLYDVFDNPYQSAYTQSRTSKYDEDGKGRLIIDLFYLNAPGISMTGRLSDNAGSFVYGDQDLKLQPVQSPDESFLYLGAKFHALGLSYRLQRETNTELRFQNQVVVNGQFNINDNFLVGFLDNGNPSFRGRRLPGVLDVGGELTAYNRTTLGVRRDVNYYGKWNVGAQLHYYSGLYHTEAGLNNSFLFTQQDGEFIQAYTEGRFRSSTSLDSLQDGDFDIADALTNNNGLGFSLGLEYFIRDDFSVFFSAKDVGSITWDYNAETITIDSASIQWEGVNYNEEFEGFEVTEIDSFARANDGYFEADTSQGSYTNALPTTLELGVYKRWSPRLKTILLFGKQFPEDPFRTNLIAHYQLFSGLHINGSAGFSSDGLFSLGSYLFYNSNLFNIYIGSEQLSHLFLKQGSLGADLSLGMGLKF